MYHFPFMLHPPEISSPLLASSDSRWISFRGAEPPISAQRRADTLAQVVRYEPEARRRRASLTAPLRNWYQSLCQSHNREARTRLTYGPPQAIICVVILTRRGGAGMAVPCGPRRESASESPRSRTERTALNSRTIRVCELTKRYGDDWSPWRALLRRSKRSRLALDRVSFDVRPRELFVLLGPNGAGKTTLLKVLAGVLAPDGGTALVAGHDVRLAPSHAKAATTLVKSQAWLGALCHLTAQHNLEFQGRLAGVCLGELRRRVQEVLELLRLEHRASSYGWTLSAGELQKLSLAAAFLVRTQVVLLDEPTAHLDPRVTREVRGFIKNTLNGRFGQTIILSTHNMEEAEMLADRVAILHQGRVVAVGSPRSLIAEVETKDVLNVRVLGYYPDVTSCLEAVPHIDHVTCRILDAASGRAVLRIRVRGDAEARASVPYLLASLGLHITAVQPARPSLEDVFIMKTKVSP